MDEALFYWKEDNQLIGVTTWHVDDFVLCGTPQLLDNITESIKRLFHVSSENNHAFTYIGLEIKQDNTHITISQRQYNKEICQIKVPESEPSTLLDKVQKRDLKSLAGRLNWISTHSRPEPGI